MSKWTKGPWRIANGTQIRSDRDQIARVNMMRNGEGKANANLIAAAPDLYESHEPDRLGPDFLDWVADRLVIHGDHPSADFIICLRRRAEKARAALAKARGE